MKLIKYLFRKFMLPSYIIISAVISVIFTFTAHCGMPVFLRMTAVTLLILLILRAWDDICDFESDSKRKRQYLSKKELIILVCTLSAAFTGVNVLFYGLTGLISIAAVGYILLMEKLPPLKAALMPLLFTFYYYANGCKIGAVQLMTFAVCFAAALAYCFIKGRIRK